MLRCKVIPVLFALGAAMLAAGDESPTAPFSDPPAAVRSASQAAAISVPATPFQSAETRVSSRGHGRSRYSVILC